MGQERTGEAKHTLTIVLPALNEEQAIGSTVSRCLEARAAICERTGVRDVEVLVVSDGSSDRTEEIALGFPEIGVLAFERNRGYGAAIKAGFERARGDLLAFMDADGTCDPLWFADLCQALEREGADLAVGARLGGASRMPWIRVFGNRIFAWMLGVLSKQLVQDTASGMRVIRRSALADLYPLPDGLHFTPAMTARVLLEQKLRWVEVPIPYAERTGRSKLSVLGDGLRFLTAILQAAMCYRPARPLLLAAGVIGALSVAIGVGPVAYWLRVVRVEEWMIYRVLLASLLATIVAILVCSAVVADRIAVLANTRPAHASGATALLARLFTPRLRLVVAPGLVALGLFIVWPGVVEWFSTGEVYMHWSRAALASLLVVIAVAHAAAVFLLGMMELIRQRRAPGAAPPPDRVRQAR